MQGLILSFWQVSKAGRRQEDQHMPVVIQCEHINKADFTAASGFKAMVEDFEGREQPVSFTQRT